MTSCPCIWQCGPHPSGTEHTRICEGRQNVKRETDTSGGVLPGVNVTAENVI